MNTAKKEDVRRAFNAATKTYDAAADWQKNVGDVLLSYVDEIKPFQKTILDLGAGTSYLANHILQRYPDNHLIPLDIAESMLLFSKQHISDSTFVCADAESLPLQSESIDLIISNMMLHWCDSLEETLHQQYEALRPGGLFIFSILGPRSLQALKTAWNKVDDHSHINQFPNENTIRKNCLSANLNVLRFESHKIQKYYENVYELMHHLKATGAKNVSANKPKGLMGKEKIKQLGEQYKNPLNYEIFTVICKK